MTVVTRWATCIVQICVYEAADAAQKGVTLDPEKFLIVWSTPCLRTFSACPGCRNDVTACNSQGLNSLGCCAARLA